MTNIQNISEAAETAILKSDIILAFDDILNENEFKKALRQSEIINKLEENKKRISVMLNAGQRYIERGEIKIAYTIWENILSPLLLQNEKYQKVSLMVISNMEQTEDLAWRSKERDMLTATDEINAILNNKNEINMLFKNTTIQQYFSHHLHEMLRNVDTSQVQVDKSKKPTEFYYNNVSYELQNYIKSKKSRQKRYITFFNSNIAILTLRQLMYGKSDTWYGNVADAFIQHIAHMHSQIFAESINNDFSNIGGRSVFNEEGSNILQLLADSRNNVPWYTGGDLILKLQHGVILNIQLKTTHKLINFSSNKEEIVGNISYKRIKELFNRLQVIFNGGSIETEIDNLSEILFKELKTSAWIEKVDKQVKNGVSKLMKKN